MVGERLLIILADSGDVVAELFIENTGILSFRAFVPGTEEDILSVLEILVATLGFPLVGPSSGYRYQPAPGRYLLEAVGIVDGLMLWDRPICGRAQGISWCPYMPKGMSDYAEIERSSSKDAA